MACHEGCSMESHFQLQFIFLYTVASESSHSWSVGMSCGWNRKWGACGHPSPLSIGGVHNPATITIVLAFVVISFLLCYHGYGPTFSLVFIITIMKQSIVPCQPRRKEGRKEGRQTDLGTLLNILLKSYHSWWISLAYQGHKPHFDVVQCSLAVVPAAS